MTSRIKSPCNAARRSRNAARKAAFAAGQGQAAEILADFLERHPGKALSGYMPMRTEIDPLPAMAAHQGPVGVPVIMGAGQPLRFAAWGPGVAMEAGAFGALVPQAEALRAAAELASRYINDRHMPDKAIDVIDEAGAYQRLQPEANRVKRIDVPQVEDIVAKIARIPPKHVTSSDKELLRNLERDLKLTVFGQDQAIDSLATAIKLSRAGLKSPDKPVGSFLFAGPTGVGKTEAARQLAKALGVELVRFDMSEYMERHTVSRLIGAPPGYVGFDQGGLLTEAITKQPHCVLLLDEIEKAHPEVFNLLLQVMDHGTLTDNNGRKADFRNVILIMTTNAGAETAARASIGFTHQDHASDAMEVIRKSFTPEFRNRLDTIIQFGRLSTETIKSIVDKFLIELQAQLEDKRVLLEVSDEARGWLAVSGYDVQMGARPMARLIQDKIKRPLAEEILFGELAEHGGVVHVDLRDGELVFDFETTAEVA